MHSGKNFHETGLTAGLSSTWKCSSSELQVLHGRSTQHNTVFAGKLIALLCASLNK